MSGRSGQRADRAERFLTLRRARLERILDRPLPPPSSSSLPAERRVFLLEEAVDLYWNEFAWERLTAEEMGHGSQQVERTFPGVLALVDALLRKTAAAASTPASPSRPEVVEEVLVFLADRCVGSPAGERAAGPVEREMACRLMDLVLYRLHELRPSEIERVEIARLQGDE